LNLANEVSTMETELISLRQENNVLKRQLDMSEFELDQAKKALAKAAFERDHHMNKRGELKALLDAAGTLLVHGVRKYHDTIDEEAKPEEPAQIEKKAAE
jgi:hypothetical protein